MTSWPNLWKWLITNKAIALMGLFIITVGAIYLAKSHWMFNPSQNSSNLRTQQQSSTETPQTITSAPTVKVSSPQTTQPSLIPTTLTHEAITLTDLPTLYPNLTWQITTTTPDQMSSFIIYADKKVLLDWKAYKATKTVSSSREYTELSTGFSDYYATKLSKIGWSDWQGIAMNGVQLELENANGPTGYIQGFVGSKENRFRVVFIQETNEDVLKGTPSVKVTYPQRFSYMVFVSESVPMDRLSLLLKTAN